MFKDNPAEYQKRIKAAKRVSADVDDNLIKMALKIVTSCKKEELLKYAVTEDIDGTVDVEEGNV